MADTATNANNTNNANNTAETKFEYNGDRLYFTPDELPKMVEVAEKIKETTGKPVHAWADEWPEGAGGAILPLSKNEPFKDDKGNEEKRRVLYAVLVWPLWSMETIRNADGGDEFLRSMVADAQAARNIAPLRRQDIESGAIDTDGLPRTVVDFIEGAGDRGIVKPYTEAVKLLLPKLKSMHAVFAHLTPAILRQYLSNAMLASSFNERLEREGFFLGIIGKLREIAVKQGNNTEIFDRWIETRNEAQMEDFDTLSLDKLSI